ncbi:hypothetical protein TIFTF001_028299 [Ficus carica]|uniref:Uncharacterized protein n=1 Tax=Ficus carica TaxID=3494 RepID=A0AA88DPM3_FICCA|nr:hypothetical protein TIFTF001_028299 [Ficus carica]
MPVDDELHMGLEEEGLRLGRRGSRAQGLAQMHGGSDNIGMTTVLEIRGRQREARLGGGMNCHFCC